MGLTFTATDIEGNRMFTAQEIADFTREAVAGTHPDDLAYLAVTGKMELPVRDALGAYLTRRFPEFTAAREYRRRDLAILRDGIPAAIIEGKIWISFEASVPEKLHNPNPKDGLVAAMKSDIAKMNDLRTDRPFEKFASTVLFAADIRELDRKHLPAVKYPNWHRRGLGGQVGLLSAHNAGVQRFREAVAKLGECAETCLFEGHVFGMPVRADVVVCKIIG